MKVIKEDNEFGKYEDRFIKAILSQNATALHKGAESRKIYNKNTGEMEDRLLWDSVLHHNDGNHDNNPFDFSNYTLIQCDNYSTAMLIHKLIHLLSFAENGNVAEDIKSKIKSYNAEFITLLDNKLNIQDFDAWWNTIGSVILNSAAEEINTMQPSKQLVLEDLNNAKSIIADQIRGEWEAIQNYNKAIEDLSSEQGFDNVMKLLNDIADEEEAHVGELQQALSTIDDNVDSNVDDGKAEAEEKLANPVDNSDDIAIVEETLTEKVGSETIDEIDKYLDDIYALRHDSLATDGEYSTGNLIFKEARNKGYLDNLKELKNKLISKQLSLESLNEGMSDFVSRTTQNFKKESGQILCNKGEQETEVLTVLKKYYSNVESIKGKGGRVNIKYSNKILKEDGVADVHDDAIKEEVYKGITIEYFPYTWMYGDNSEEIEGWIIKSPYYIQNSSGKKSFMPLYCEDEEGNELNFNSLEAAKNYIDKYIITKKGKIKIKYGNEAHYELLPELEECDVIKEDTEKIKDHKWVNRGKAGTHGEFKTKKEADAQRKAIYASGWKHEDLSERLDERQRREHRDELGRISFNQAIIQDSGLFNIYNVKENDVDRIVRQIRDLDYIEWVNKTAGQFDFSKAVVFGQMQPRYYTITGKIKD